MGRPALTEQQFQTSLLVRFWKNVQKTDTCWLWTASLNDQGYGQMTYKNRRPDRCHRISWRIHYGEIHDGLCVLHRCDVRHCVRPDHLFLGTRTDNMRDKVEKGRQAGPARRTHCPKGHEYDEQNTRVKRRANGTWYKQCRICDRENKRNRQREYMREYRAKKRAA